MPKEDVNQISHRRRKQTIRRLSLLCALAILGAGCGEDTTTVAAPSNPYAGYKSERYSNDALWLCRPGLAVDQCLNNPLDATALLADGSVEIEHHQAAADPEVDCFYVYPTVDLTLTPGNHTDFSDLKPMLDPLLSQVARFTQSCRVFAPLYRQATIGSYVGNHPEIFDLAYSDVVDAFRHYMGQYNNGRRFIIMGHSQGTDMTTRLLQGEIDGVPELREKMVVALLIGGSVEVPIGKAIGGTFQNLPLCTSEEQTECVIAYRTFAAAQPPTGSANAVSGPGLDLACTNPAALASGKGTLSSAYFPLHTNEFMFTLPASATALTTPFVSYPNFYSAECIPDAKGVSYLQISAPANAGDPRIDPIPYDNALFSGAFLGTHILDYNFPLGDLLHLVDVKIAASNGRS